MPRTDRPTRARRFPGSQASRKEKRLPSALAGRTSYRRSAAQLACLEALCGRSVPVLSREPRRQLTRLSDPANAGRFGADTVGPGLTSRCAHALFALDRTKPSRSQGLSSDTDDILCTWERPNGRVAAVSIDTRPSNAALGSVIRSLRSDHGLTIEGLAHAADLHPTYVSGIERGRNNPSLETLRRLAAALGVRLSEVIRRAEAPDGVRGD
jgi:DNA-binding XRE family transcriptional regulator